MKSINLNKVMLLKHQSECKKYPSMPPDYIPLYKYTDKTANGLTRAICDFLNLSGCQAERISSTGRMLDNTKIVSDVMGIKRSIGSTKYIKGTGTNGTADISSTIMGYSVKIEVKIGKDRQSADQKKYQEQIELAFGQYWIAKTFDDFYEQYEDFIKKNPR